MNTSPWSVCFAIAGIVVLMSIGLLTGHDGTLLNLSLIAIAGLGGFSLAKVLKR